MSHQELISLSVGGELSNLDIFLTSNSTAINANAVHYIVFDASDVVTTSGIATNPSVGRYQASGTVPAGFTLGLWQIDFQVFPIGAASFTASEEFNVNAVSVSFGFTPTTDRTHSVYDAVRLDLGDPTADIFDDGLMRRILTKAIRRLNQALGLDKSNRGPIGIQGNFGGQRIRVNNLEVNLDTGVFTPTGSEYEDLIVLQMEYIIASSEVSALKRLAASGPFGSSAGNDGITVINADGVQVSVSANRLSARASLTRFDAELKRKELEDAIKLVRGRLAATFGKSVWS